MTHLVVGEPPVGGVRGVAQLQEVQLQLRRLDQIPAQTEAIRECVPRAYGERGCMYDGDKWMARRGASDEETGKRADGRQV